MNILPKNPGKTLIEIAYLAVVFVAIYFVLPKTLIFVLPFVFAYVISKPINRVLDSFNVKRKISKNLTIIFVLLLFVSVVCALLFVLIYQSSYEIQKIATVIPHILYGEVSLPPWAEHIKSYFISLPEPIHEFGTMVIDSVRNNLSTILRPATQAVISVASDVAGVMPDIIVFVIVMILSAYFMCSDRERIGEFFKNTIPSGIVRRSIYIKEELIKACGGYLKAQFILMCVTFVVVLLGLIVLGVDTSVLMAFIVALVDAVPILGAGTILIPWAIIVFVSGKYFLGVGLVIIYAISFLIRRIFEPKIVSNQIGLHPLVTLASIYIGLRAMGVFGMILGPIFAIIVINFIKAENKYRREKEM